MIEARNCEPRVRRAGREHALQSLGSVVNLLVTGEETAGRFAVVETRERRGAEPPRHVHTREDELVYVLEGEVTFYAGGERIACPAGACLLLPRGCEHTFVVESGEARLLVLLLPAGLEGYYRELSRPGEQGGEPAQDGRLDVERLVTVAARYGVEITGPPRQE